MDRNAPKGKDLADSRTYPDRSGIHVEFGSIAVYGPSVGCAPFHRGCAFFRSAENQPARSREKAPASDRRDLSLLERVVGRNGNCRRAAAQPFVLCRGIRPFHIFGSKWTADGFSLLLDGCGGCGLPRHHSDGCFYGLEAAKPAARGNRLTYSGLFRHRITAIPLLFCLRLGFSPFPDLHSVDPGDCAMDFHLTK